MSNGTCVIICVEGCGERRGGKGGTTPPHNQKHGDFRFHLKSKSFTQNPIQGETFGFIRRNLKNLRRHEPDLTPDRTWWREAHELQGLHSHTGSISWARTRETRRAQNAYTCPGVIQPGRCGSGGTKSTFLGVSDTGPRGHFVDLGEI